MKTSELLEKAIGIAVEAHRGQTDRYGAPYILHPIRVMCAVKTEVQRMVAILHDVVEDTEWSFEDLRREGFPEEVVAALDGVTKREGEPYEAFVERSARNAVARVVKLADLEDNMNVLRSESIGAEDLPRLNKYVAAWRRLAPAE